MLQSSIDLQGVFQLATSALADGDPGAALNFAHHAWTIAPNNPDVCNLIGVCAIALGDSDKAEQCWKHAISLHPESDQAHYNLATLCMVSDRVEEAEYYLRRTVALAPQHQPAYARLGLLLAQCKRAYDAERCYQWALGISPEDAATFSNLGVLLAAQKRHDQAELAYQRALVLEPANAQAHTNLGLLLEILERFRDAEHCQQRATSIDPQSAEIQSNLANLLASRERFTEAELSYRQAIAIDKRSPIAHSNFGVLLAHWRRHTESEQHFRMALSLEPEYQLARLNLAMLLLAQGRFGEGWELHESRYHDNLPDPDAPKPNLPFAQWQGEPLSGKTLLVWPEQGLGDMIQFCRYLPLLKEQEAVKIILVCRQPLLELMRTLRGVDEVYAVEDVDLADISCDYWTFPMSLPTRFGTEVASVPAMIPYLHATPERRATWARHLPPAFGNLRVGLVWQGNAMHANDARRSLPHFSTLAPLLSIEGVQFVSLQHGAAAEQASGETSFHDLIELGSKVEHFADTAAILDQLDLLISVDTAVAHLAGALGKPCWVLLPYFRTDWRWMHDREDSPWYPEKMRLFRQSASEDWHAVVERVALSLRILLASQ